MSKPTNILALICLLVFIPRMSVAGCLRTGIGFNYHADPAVSLPATTQFTDNSDGTVTDTKTGLMWKKCSEGQTGNDCSGSGASGYSWKAGLEQAQTVNNSGGFATYRDWRVPNIKELASIIERQRYSPAINLIVFPNTTSLTYWSSSPYVGEVDFNGGGSNAWYVDFNYGLLNVLKNGGNCNIALQVRLVRGGQ